MTSCSLGREDEEVVKKSEVRSQKLELSSSSALFLALAPSSQSLVNSLAIMLNWILPLFEELLLPEVVKPDRTTLTNHLGRGSISTSGR